MSGTDFIDDDLVQRRDPVKEVKMGPAYGLSASEDIHRSEPVTVQELSLTPLSKRKEEISGQVASKMDELERLRTRQESLEKEKSSLEYLKNSQEKYESGKREMVDRLEQSLVSLEREEVRLNKRTELLADTEKRFKEMLSELQTFNEKEWPAKSDGLREELSKALVVIDNIRKDYNKSFAKIEVLRESKTSSKEDKQVLFNDLSGEFRKQMSFIEWLKVGIAISLPVTLALIALIVVICLRIPVF